MEDWIEFFNQLMYWAQWLTSVTIVGLFALAVLGLFINRKMTISCGILAVALILVTVAFAQLGIQLLVPEITALFQNLFK